MVFFNSSVLSDPPEDLRQSSELVPAADQRFAMRMSRQLFDSLWILSKKEEIPRADIVRRALGLYALALEEEKKGNLIGFAHLNSDGHAKVDKLIRLQATPKEFPLHEKRSDSNDYCRYEMRMTSDLFSRLGFLSEEEEIPRADIVRRALGLYAKAVEAKAKSQIIAFVKICQENSVEVVRLLKLDN